MLTPADLQNISTERMQDAQALLNAGRFDGAMYLCGYAVEIALKRRTCLTLNWQEFPQSPGEFSSRGLHSLKTHDLPTLLRFTGMYPTMILDPNWVTVQNWSPENRYKPASAATYQDAESMVNAALAVMRTL